ncbi:MAG: ARPP-1 family domain-containing protein [Syntrophales bacterium]
MVTEVTEGRKVPELRVINLADKPVLLLDGERLSGPKQNRTLNISPPLGEKWETIIPAICTDLKPDFSDDLTYSRDRWARPLFHSTH